MTLVHRLTIWLSCWMGTIHHSHIAIQSSSLTLPYPQAKPPIRQNRHYVRGAGKDTHSAGTAKAEIHGDGIKSLVLAVGLSAGASYRAGRSRPARPMRPFGNRMTKIASTRPRPISRQSPPRACPRPPASGRHRPAAGPMSCRGRPPPSWPAGRAAAGDRALAPVTVVTGIDAAARPVKKAEARTPASGT